MKTNDTIEIKNMTLIIKYREYNTDIRKIE